jgi:hypothetical protein
MLFSFSYSTLVHYNMRMFWMDGSSWSCRAEFLARWAEILRWRSG